MTYAQEVAHRLREGIKPKPIINPSEKKAGDVVLTSMGKVTM